MSSSIVKRRKSREIFVGNLPLGGNNPIRIQSMTNTNTMNTEATVAQCMRLADIGCEYIRITAPRTKDAENLAVIKNELHKRNYTTPLIADIHYNPKAAEVAAQIVEKIRINPGNYVDKNIGKFHFSEAEYSAELERITNRMHRLIEICKSNQTAVRIGTNHGSLSERIMSRYGDTPAGMMNSSMEFIRICRSFDFHNLVLSMKASNVKTMIHATRLLVSQMEIENMDYPIHLGVTEAGADEDGRIKSAAGIACLLNEGIGDTIRVSLTENPEAEIPVAKKIVSYYSFSEPTTSAQKPLNQFEYKRSITNSIQDIGAENKISVLSTKQDEITDYFFEGNDFISDRLGIKYPVFDEFSKINNQNTSKLLNFFVLQHLDFCIVEKLQTLSHPFVLILHFDGENIYSEQIFLRFMVEKNIKMPIVVWKSYASTEDYQLKGAGDFTSLLIEGFSDGICCGNETQTALDILQATGLRISKAEFISCPSCGRTEYDIEKALNAIKARMSHLKGIKIGVMGCIVNGPGEMADAHYGYVGSGKGKITLYKGKTVVNRCMDEELAVDALIALIKENGDWEDE